MKERRTTRTITVCPKCARKIDPAIGICVECSSIAGIAFTRRTDPTALRPPRYGPRKVVGAK